MKEKTNIKRKLKKIAIICLISFWTTVLLQQYLYYYPADFDFRMISESINWISYIIPFISVLILSAILSFLPFKKFKYFSKFYILSSVFTFSFIIYMLFIGGKIFWMNNKEFTFIRNEFRKDAMNDIKNDNVKTFSYGLPLPPKNQEQALKENKKDSILKKYGLHLKNLGCIVGDPILTKSQEEYERLTSPYLEKRNGKGWEEKMKKEIDDINKN